MPLGFALDPSAVPTRRRRRPCLVRLPHWRFFRQQREGLYPATPPVHASGKAEHGLGAAVVGSSNSATRPPHAARPPSDQLWLRQTEVLARNADRWPQCTRQSSAAWLGAF